MSTAGKAIVITSTQEMDEVMDDSEPVEATPSVPDDDMIHDGTESSQGGRAVASGSSAGASYTAESDADMDGGESETADQPHADEDDSASDTSSEDDRDNAELAAIMLEIKDLEAAVPLLRDSYHLIDRLGEGTFSSVYKAIDVHHTLYDNARWAPPSPPDSLGSGRAKGFDEPIVTTEAPSPPLSTRSSPVVDPFLATSGETPRNGFAQQLQRQAIAAGKVTPSLQSRPSRKGPVYVALKRIYVTSSPQRILNELDLLADLRCAGPLAPLAWRS